MADPSRRSVRTTISRSLLPLPNSLVFIVLLGISIFAPSQPIRAFDLGSAVNSLGNAISSAGQGLVGGIGNLVGWGAGALAGPAVSNTFDPVIDHFSQSLKDTGTQLIDHAGDTARNTGDQLIDHTNIVISAQLDTLNKDEKDRIDQAGSILYGSIDKVQGDVQIDLGQVDKISNGLLDHGAAIAQDSLNRGDQIINGSIAHVGTVIDQSLNHAQGIENDAFDKIQIALEDQVPVTSRLVTREIVFGAAAIIFLVVIVGFGGVMLLRRFTRSMDEKRMARRISHAFDFLPAELVTVVAPMAVLAAVILAGYYALDQVASQERLSQLTAGAEQLEQAGEFSAAMKVRERISGIDPSPEASYYALRDRWLASANDPHSNPERVAQNGRALSSLLDATNNPSLQTFVDSDGEVIGATLYLAEKSLRLADRSRDEGSQASPPGDGLAVLAQKLRDPIDKYQHDPRFQKSVFRRYVLMSSARLKLDDPKQPTAKRLDDTEKLAEEIITTYPHYAPGFVLAYNIQRLRADQARFSPKQDDPATFDAKAQDYLSAVVLNDPDLGALLRSTDFRTQITPHEYDDLKSKGAAAINTAMLAWQEKVERLLRPAIGNVLARTQASRLLPLLSRQVFVEHELNTAVSAARSKTAQHDDFCKAFTVAVVAGQRLVASDWLAVVSEHNCRISDNGDVTDGASYAAGLRLSEGMAYVF